MNKEIRQAERTEETDNQTKEPETKITAREKTERLLGGLVPELNFRLFLETEPSARLLWVEAITVTAYESAPLTECPESRSPSDALLRGDGTAGRLWKRLTRMQDKLRSFKK